MACGCAALSILLLVVADASGETRYVSSERSAESPFTSWKTAAHDIASALDVADDGDQIVVASGTYPIAQTIFVNRAITLRSAAGARKTYCGAAHMLWGGLLTVPRGGETYGQPM